MKRKLKVLVGVPGIGKSTYTKNIKGTVFSSDEYRMELFGKLEQGRNHELFEVMHGDIHAYFEENEEGVAIYDATNLLRFYRSQIYAEFKDSAEVQILYFKAPLEKAIARNGARLGERRVPEERIREMYDAQEEPVVNEDCDEFLFISLD